MKYCRAALALILAFSTFSALAVELTSKPYAKASFNPNAGERFEFVVAVPNAGELTVEIVSPDGDTVTTLASRKKVKAGELPLVWGGKDDKGNIVPDEAWFPRISLTGSNGTELRFDPLTTTGGEVIESVPMEVGRSGAIRFELPHAARILGRAGVKAGPMMRALADWAPRAAGSNVLQWDGFDQSNVVRVLDHPDAAVMVTAYQLQDGAIITTGNDQLAYAQYRNAKDWPEIREARRELGKTRDGKALSAAYFEPKYWPLSPKATLTLKTPLVTVDGEEVAKIERPVAVEVNVEKDQRWILERGLFEVGFFIDYQFIAEEEQGYLPFVWKLDPSGLKPGKHVLTVNISGFEGQIALASVLFYVPAP